MWTVVYLSNIPCYYTVHFKNTMKKDIRQVTRQNFFSKQVHMEAWKKSMTGENEKLFIEILDMNGYKRDQDYKWQYPIADRYIIDVAFPDEKIAVEIDDDTHRCIKKIRKDAQRDSFLQWNNWVVLRIPERRLIEDRSFYYHLIKEIVEERRKTPIIKNENYYEQ